MVPPRYLAHSANRHGRVDPLRSQSNEPVAHLSKDGRFQPLYAHLTGTAEKAEKMAAAFGCAKWGHMLGLWHDLGKYQDEFQAKLQGKRIAVEHSGAGAALSFRQFKDLGIPVAFAIAGHHTGLANAIKSEPDSPTPLRERLEENQPMLERILSVIPRDITRTQLPELPAFLRAQSSSEVGANADLKRRTEFWVRFLFSALVDADRLDTEEFTNPLSANLRARFDSISELKERLDSYVDSKVGRIPPELRNSPVNSVRARVLEACREASRQAPGTFALTVPTGGGKTLSAMSFALRHAAHNNLRRVIVVIPYTSIIEQNAQEYRNALGAENVIEHHSNIDLLEFKKVHGEEIAERLELACENWDAPVIVTTSVQFFESLFSNRPSRCRKLHNIARSVIILDEVQTLPPGLLLSILDALNDLVAHFGCSIVLSTATPPALASRERFDYGLKAIMPIVGDKEHLGQKLKRVECAWPNVEEPPVDWIDLAKQIAKHPQVLTVVHKRNDARILAQHLQKMVPDEPVFHLSALMCPAHRLVALAEIKETLKRGAACRLVSTQLIEAGVDIDFPVVYRALGGLDSVVQAAGRCNREGKLEKGQVVIFRAQTSPPLGTPKRGMKITESLLKDNGGTLDIDDCLLMETYFRAL